jgi:hypothetical protein
VPIVVVFVVVAAAAWSMDGEIVVHLDMVEKE